MVLKIFKDNLTLWLENRILTRGVTIKIIYFNLIFYNEHLTTILNI